MRIAVSPAPATSWRYLPASVDTDDVVCQEPVLAIEHPPEGYAVGRREARLLLNALQDCARRRVTRPGYRRRLK